MAFSLSQGLRLLDAPILFALFPSEPFRTVYWKATPPEQVNLTNPIRRNPLVVYRVN
jgi:hypothetical protein